MAPELIVMTESRPNGSPSSGWKPWAAAAVISVAIAVAYSNTFTGPMIFDDVDSIEQNPYIRRLWPPSHPLSLPLWATGKTVDGRPVLSLSFALNHTIFGPGVAGFHAVNLAIHMLAALTLFGIIRRTLCLPQFAGHSKAASTWLAMTAALLWAVHPLQTQAVTYIVQRAESLTGLFYLLTVYAACRAFSGGESRWFGISLIVCGLGMGTKEVMITAPVVVLLYDRTFHSGSFLRALSLRWKYYLALSALGTVPIVLLVLTGSKGGSGGLEAAWIDWWSYAKTQPEVIWHYLRLCFWPAPLILDYDWPPASGFLRVGLPSLGLAGLLGLTTLGLARRRWWGLAGAWFFLILLPSSSVVALQQLCAEHRMYLSSAAVVAIVCELSYAGWRSVNHAIAGNQEASSVWRVSGFCVTASAACALIVLTLLRNRDYRTSEAIWADTVAKKPHNALARANLGVALSEKGDSSRAISEFRSALQLQPSNANTLSNLGWALWQLGLRNDAEQELRKALVIKPDHVCANVNLGWLLACVGQADEAMQHYHRAIDADPAFYLAHNNLGLALAERGQLDLAIPSFRRALELAPEYEEARVSLGKALMLLGQKEEAERHLRKVLQINPNHAMANTNLGVLLASRGQTDEAITHYERAITADPRCALAHYNLGLLLASHGHKPRAISEFRKVLEVAPDYEAARVELDRLLAEEAVRTIRPAAGY